ncbi:BQ2448_6258 [Microbotryum intermedium]|uniref:D-lactate dehydrogenase (cytochrome) n=1 Tax=Microbotryum intermedium TaxID=269621 RepID=A0A238FRI3_9BASI|nr:BQ2448_6258 [Microbotryum intermedium]
MQAILRPSSRVVKTSSRRAGQVRWASNSHNNAGRAHPLARPSIPIRRPTFTSTTTTSTFAARNSKQRVTALTTVLLATLTGALSYLIGLKTQGPTDQSADPASSSSSYKEPTRRAFDAAVKELQALLPEHLLSLDRDSLVARSHSDWASHDPSGLPGAILFPRGTQDVVNIVKLANKYSIPIIPMAANTSLEGHTGALTYKSNPSDAASIAKRGRGECITLDDLEPGLAWVVDVSENMNEIIKIHDHDLQIVVQPGISYDAINETLAEKNIPLFFPVDPAPGAMIGGMIGTGASGTNAVRHGTMRENVYNLTVVLADGSVIKTRSRAKKSSAGPNLTQLFIGSEGTLGIVTEATLRLVPKLPQRVGVSGFPTIEDAANAARDLVQQGVGLACIELLDDVMVKMINAKGGGITWEEKPSLFLKFEGTQAQIAEDVERTKKIVRTNNGSKFTFSRNDKEAENIWYSRKMGLYAVIDYVPGSKVIVTDVCVPPSQFPALVAATKADISTQGLIGPFLSHAGDGNFHALLSWTTQEEKVRGYGVVARMVERAQALDGTCTGEHGVGMGKIKYLEAELGSGTIDIMRKIKHLLDPKGIFNPGKLIKEGPCC